MAIHKPLLLTLFAATFLAAQPFSFGVRGGVPLNTTDTGDSRYKLDVERWTVGPTGEIRLPFGLSLGADALYRRVNTNNTRTVGGGTFTDNYQTNVWEFPYYATYRAGAGPVRPFVRGGGVSGRFSNDGTYVCTGEAASCGTATPGQAVAITGTNWSHGFLFGGGLQMKLGKLKVEPEFRYTRWTSDFYGGTSRNQPSVLLGITF